MKKQELEKREVVVEKDHSVNALISQAIAANLDVEKMERLFSLREKVKAEMAKEAYVSALSRFQGDCPVIEKTKKVLNKDGRTVRYQYAPIDTIAEQIKKPLVENGLSYKWDVENKAGFIKATTIITHELGHSEVSSFEVPVDTEGYMTAPQKYASALTFAKRYSLCNALGISTGEEDTDATDVGKELDPKSEKSKIIFLLRALGHNPKSKEEYVEIVQKITLLDLSDEKNHNEIVARLEVLKSEKENENNTKGN